ncbi:EAL domain-containing protein [Rhizobium rhizogenes]|uniref:EAL domain-containing protein n=1 Tax=Rhizobium rhizogenes TaxID=359 RepID=UPI0022BFB80A|nr:EAL domain-containing protein [Rhizobium rhizogenes]MCZ7463977.1 EAL domain-containing protein [Rhizobium rhizogenes]
MIPPRTGGVHAGGHPQSSGVEEAVPAVLFGFSSEPVVDLGSLSPPPVYSECLARLQFDGRPPVSAGVFVGRLEASGEGGLVDIAMLNLVLEALKGDPDLVLGCNVSPHTVADASSWSAMIKCLERAGSAASRLVLEITEGLPLDEIPAAGIRLKAARTLGCRIAIDDFGAGASNLPRLFRVEAVWDIVKIDGSCFGRFLNDRFVVNVLRPTFELASCLAPFVVVTGIETQHHLNAARAVGAQYGQGWHFPHSQHQKFVRPEKTFAIRIASYLREKAGWPERIADSRGLA